jgi:PAS domain S-box-containing protein
MANMKTQESRRILNLKKYISNNAVILVGILLWVLFIFIELVFHATFVHSPRTFFEILFQPNIYEVGIRLTATLLLIFLIVCMKILVRRTKEDRSRMEQSEERYRAVFEQASNSIAIIDAETGGFVEFNRMAYESLGYTRDELKKISLEDIEVIESSEEAKKHITKILEEGQDVFETKHKTKSGDILDILVNATFVEMDNKKYIQSVWTDITKQKKTEAMLKRERDRAQRYLDIAGVILIAIGADKKVSLVNKKGCEVLGCSEKDIIGKNWFDNFVPRQKESDIEHIFTEMMSGNIEAEKAEGPILAKNGSERIISWHNVSIKDDDGNVIGTLSSGEDVTDQRRMQDEIIKKNKELESFVYTVSHDLKSPLVTFNGFIEYLVMENKGRFDEKSKHIIERLKANVRHMDHLIRDLLEYSRIGRTGSGKKEIKVKDLVVQTAEDFAQICQGQDIEIKLKEICDCTIYAEEAQIRQALSNLVDNAIKFIDTSDVGREKKIEFICHAPKNGRVQFCIKDNGIGVDPKYHEKIFEIFHRLNPENIETEGTGIGLTLVKKIVEENNGSIRVVSEEGQGAEFWIDLPSAKEVRSDKK